MSRVIEGTGTHIQGLGWSIGAQFTRIGEGSIYVCVCVYRAAYHSSSPKKRRCVFHEIWSVLFLHSVWGNE